MGGGGKSLSADLPVEQTHDALDDRDVGRFWRLSAVQQQRRYLLLAAEIGIEVASRADRWPACGSQGRCSPARP